MMYQLHSNFNAEASLHVCERERHKNTFKFNAAQ